MTKAIKFWVTCIMGSVLIYVLIAILIAFAKHPPS